MERAGIPPMQSRSEKLYPADIIPHLSDNNGHTRKRVIEVLTGMGESAFLPLVYAAYHPDKAMRIGALHALCPFRHQGAPHIIRALEDSDLDVQHAVYQILNEQDGKNGLPRVGGPALNVGTLPRGAGANPLLHHLRILRRSTLRGLPIPRNSSISSTMPIRMYR